MEHELIVGNNGLAAMDTANTAVATREQTEIQSAIIVAKKFPRDETIAYNKIVKAFERPALAEDAIYSFPRGGQAVEGPSVVTARVAAAKWGNIRYGIRYISADDDYIHIKGYAIDLENNTSIEVDDKFKALVYRKRGGWVKPDERDLRELVNRRGAILERNAILKLIPQDVIEAAVKKARETLKKAVDGQLETNMEDYVRALVASYDKIGVTGEMLVKYLGHGLKAINRDEVLELKTIYKSLKDGHSKREDYFDLGSDDNENSTAAEWVYEIPFSAREETKPLLDANGAYFDPARKVWRCAKQIKELIGYQIEAPKQEGAA